MKAKKLLALITAASLVVLPTSTAFGDTLTGVTTVNYVDPYGVITVVAPTSASVGFTLDPQGLADIEGVGTWTPGSGGNILPQAVGIIVNKSAGPVKAEIAFALTDDADVPVTLVDTATGIDTGTDKNMFLTITPADDKVVAATAEIAEKTAPTYFQSGDPLADKEFSAADLVSIGLDGTSDNVVLLADAATAAFGDYVCQADAGTIADATALEGYDFVADADSITFKQVEVPAHVLIAATADTTVSQFNNATTGFADATDKVTLAASNTGLAYKLDNADFYAAKTGTNTYELRRYTYNYATVASDNYDTASFVIGGNINKNADWSDYTTGGKAISLAATYTFEFMTADEYTAAAVEGDSYNNIAYTAPAAPSIGTASYDIAADTAEDVAVSLGAGNLAATGITSIKDADDNTLALTTDYTFASTTITFTSAYVNSIIGTGTTSASKVLTVTFDNAATATVTLAFTAADSAPSVNPTSATLVASTAEVITVNFGSGADLATSITSIKDSADATLVADTDYTIAGTTLTLAADYVDSLLGDGTADVAETLTVTFDTDATATIDLTYTAADVAASVTTTTLSFSKAAPADKVINYSLGSGDSKATAVTQVYIDGAGFDKFDIMATTPQYITITGSTITLDSELLGYYAAGVDAKIYVRFDMTAGEADASNFTTPECTIAIGN